MRQSKAIGIGWTFGILSLVGFACDEVGDGNLPDTDLSYAIVDTDQTTHYDSVAEIDWPDPGETFFGQDAEYEGYGPVYTDNGDGTVTDEVTGLMWQQDPGDKVAYLDAIDDADGFDLSGYDDWRLPTVKELYSLILFSGEDPSGEMGDDTSGLVPFMDETVFGFEYGDSSAGERIIDSQWVTTSLYGGSVMGGEQCFFGVNFADGRIKCYPTTGPGGYFAIHVRGNTGYGTNDLTDNGDDTVSDASTGLTWMLDDSGDAMGWEDALAWCEGSEDAGHDDWRLPSAKELQSLVDYSRSPDVTGSAALDPIFGCTAILNEAGDDDFPWYWSSTTHAASNGTGGAAAYVAFGRATGYWMDQWQDVHGAGAQRSDPKVGDPADYPEGHGPQGDAIRVQNHVRCVRDS
jgi:hypothetical protein